MARRALLVGVDDYQSLNQGDKDRLQNLTAPIRGAQAVERLIRDSVDPDHNWTHVAALPQDGRGPVTERWLWAGLQELFADHGSRGDDLLFYFAGHGLVRYESAYLAASDTTRARGGIAMADLMALTRRAGWAKSITVILDCCTSGQATGLSQDPMTDESSRWRLPVNTSVLTASYGDRNAYERTGDMTVFTQLLVQGLEGGGVQGFDGKVNVASLVGFIHRRFEEENQPQQPTFHGLFTNIPVIRSTSGPLKDKADVYRLADDFPTPDTRIKLQPGHETHSGKTRAQTKADGSFTWLQRQFDWFKRLQTASLLEVDREDRALCNGCACDGLGNPTGAEPDDVYLTPEGQAWWAVAKRRKDRLAHDAARMGR